MGKDSNARGSSAVIAIAAILLVIAIAGLIVWNKKHQNKTQNGANSSNGQLTNTDTDPYVGWQTATSARAGFYIKYPVGWKYNSVVGDKDNVEHITISSAHFLININSFVDNDNANGGQSATTCPDCQQTISSNSFTISKLGKVDIKTIIYSLDSGQGNAVILELPDSTYYIKSPTKTNVTSSFRGISALDSLRAYQTESQAQFMSNPDYVIAKKILGSITY